MLLDEFSNLTRCKEKARKGVVADSQGREHADSIVPCALIMTAEFNGFKFQAGVFFL